MIAAVGVYVKVKSDIFPKKTLNLLTFLKKITAHCNKHYKSTRYISLLQAKQKVFHFTQKYFSGFRKTKLKFA